MNCKSDIMLSPINMRRAKYPTKLRTLKHVSPNGVTDRPFKVKENFASNKAINRLSSIESNLFTKSSNKSQNICPIKFHKTSVEDDLDKLESITSRNLIARYDWLSIEKKLIELNTKRKLSPIAEIDTSGVKNSGKSIEFIPSSIDLMKKYENSLSFNFISHRAKLIKKLQNSNGDA
ncbi:hypothetical protein SteCoe_4202 [Stentor coeruleus]|uniref:Uncharacterized protein n=1 Tax=Stentor coeruleus TaxID=5963 RepID=A0A1R2CVE6_9CILI|nr:hypothetical protein SteCoe_4202 [Stentor coeruleus]